MLSIHLAEFPTLYSERLVLRRIEKEDAPALLILRSDEVVMKYADQDKMKSIDEALKKVQLYATEFETRETIQWGISLKENKEVLIGSICLWNIQLNHYRAEIGYMLMPEFHRKGLMQEAISEVIQFAFKTLGFHSIEAQVNPFNEASIKILEKNGFVKEGHFRENYYYDGKFTDTAVYSLIKKIL